MLAKGVLEYPIRRGCIERGAIQRQSFGAPVSQFSLDFAANSYSTPSGSVGDPVVAGLMSVTRASQGYAQNNDGTWTLFANDTLRRTNKGLWIERKATSYINNQNVGAVASGTIGDTLVANVGTLPNQWAVASFPTGFFYQVLATGTNAATNLPYTRIRFSGTAGATASCTLRFMPSGSTNSGAPQYNQGDIVVGSCYVSQFAGTVAPNMFFRCDSLNGNTLANALVAGTGFISGVTANDSTPDSVAYVLPAASTPSPVVRYETQPLQFYSTIDNGRFLLSFDVVSGTFYDFTLDFIMPQMETVPDTQSRATSPIYGANLSTTWTGTVTALTSNTVASTTGIQVGMVVFGTGVSYGTHVVSIVGSTITFSKAITVTSGGTVRFIGGVRELDSIPALGTLLAMIQGNQATVVATTAAFPSYTAYQKYNSPGTSVMPYKDLPIVGINSGTALLVRKSDGSLQTGYGSGLRTFKGFLGNYAMGKISHTVSWNGTSLALSSQATGDNILGASGNTVISSVQIGTLGGTAALDGVLTKLVVNNGFGGDASVSPINADVIVYGAKPGGIVAAYRAKKEGRTVAIIGDWREHTVGGMMAGGLSFTDVVSPAKSYTTNGITGSGVNTITLTDASTLSRGLRLTNSSIPNGAYITNVSGNVITISANTTASIASGATISIEVPFVGSDVCVIRCTAAATYSRGTTQIQLSHTDNMVVGANISQHLSETAIKYGTRITAINAGVVTLSQPLVGDLSSGTLLKTWTPTGYGGIPRWVFSRANQKSGLADDSLTAEPRVFRAVFEEMLVEAGIPVYWSGGVNNVYKTGTTVTGFDTKSRTVGTQLCASNTITCKVLIGSDYEGDMLPKIGISNTYGREANVTYGENHNGFDNYTGPSSANGGTIHQPTLPDGGVFFNVDPWVTAGNPNSGVLQGISPIQVLANTGAGSGTNIGDLAYILADNTVYRWNGSAWYKPAVGETDGVLLQAYNFRLCLTNQTGQISNFFSGTTTSLTTNASTTATNVLNFASVGAVAAGWGVFGTGIPYGTTVTSVTSTTVTINNNVTVASSAVIGFLNPADFGFSTARAELYVRLIKAFSDAATAASRVFTGGMTSSQTAGQWGIADFFQGKGGISGASYLYDCNNVGGVGLDYVGGNKGYLTMNFTQREACWQDHINHVRCLWWVMLFFVDSRIPAALQTEARLWGLSLWNFTDNLSTDPANFNTQLYVREGRRMINTAYTGGGSVFSEVDVCYPNDGTAPRDPKTVAVMSYALDSHQMQRLPVYNGGNYTFWNEGGIVVFAGQSDGALGNVFGLNKRGVLSMSTIMPNQTECTNYLTTFHGSMSHPAFGAFRMEPTSMATGEAAGLLAAMAVEGNIGVQNVTYGDTSTPGSYRYRLMNTGVNLTGSPVPPVVPLVN